MLTRTSMVIAGLGVACMVAAGGGTAVAGDSYAAADGTERQVKIEAARAKALQDAAGHPKLSGKSVGSIWKRETRTLTTSLCACDYGELDCALAALDVYTIKMFGVLFRMEGYEAAIKAAQDQGIDMTVAGEQFARATIVKFVPAKERTRIEADGERCALHAIGTKPLD